MKGFIKRFLATVLTVVMLLTVAPLNGFVDLFDVSIEASAASASTWLWPVPGGKLGCKFHCNISEHSAHYKKHTGIDINGVKKGTPVIAAAAGKVTCASTGDRCSNCDQSGGGTHVEIKVTDLKNTYTSYAHLNKLAVKTGDSVSAGQVIGYVGNTGSKSVGVHLHFGVSVTTGKHFFWGKYTLKDPLDYVSEKNGVVISLEKATNIGNNTATVNSKFNVNTAVQNLSYIISTKKVDIDVDATKEANRKNTG